MPCKASQRRALKLVLVLLAGQFFLLSCMPTILDPLGAINVNIDGSSARTLTPPIDMTPANYALSGTGPGGATFSTTVSSTSATVRGLAPGSWTVSVTGKNSAGTVILQGSGTATVSPGSTTNLAVTARPVAGPGTLSLTVSWPASSVGTPQVQAQLLPSSGAAIPLTFTPPSNGSSMYSGSGIMNGYYTLSLQLLDDGAPVMGAVEVVQIVAGQTTSGTYAFTNVNTARGTIAVNITPQVFNPIVVTMSSIPALVGSGITLAVSASVPTGSPNVTYAWYLNGVGIATGSSITLNGPTSSMPLGYYRLDVTAFSSDGSRAGSTGAAFQVADVVSINLGWNANPETNLSGYKLYMGTSSGVYGTPTTVGLVTSTAVPGLISGRTYYFALSAVNTSNQESAKTAEIAYLVP